MSTTFRKEPLAALAVAFVFLLTFQETIESLYTLWTNYGRGYSHGLLLVGISCYLTSQSYKQKNLKQHQPSSSYTALILLILLCLMWATANLAGIDIAQQSLLPLIILAVINALFGFYHAKALIYPILFIYLGLPFWDWARPFLQSLTVNAVQVMVNFTGITAYIHGNYIEIPSGTFKVAQSCAGLRYMLIALTLTALHSYLSFQAYLPRILMLLWGLSLSLIANWLRVYFIVLIGYKTEMQSSIVNDHDTFGWIVFGVTLAPMLYITPWLAKLDTPPTPVKNKLASHDQAIGVHNTFSAGLVIIIMLVTSGLTNLSSFYSRNNYFSPPPTRFSSWELATSQKSWQPEFKNPTTFNNYNYINDEKQITLHIYHYEKQSETSELVSDDNSLTSLPWREAKPEITELYNGDIVNKTIISDGNSTKLVFYWYRVGDKRSRARIHTKFLQVLNMFKGDVSGNFVAFSTNCDKANVCNNDALLKDSIKLLSASYKEI